MTLTFGTHTKKVDCTTCQAPIPADVARVIFHWSDSFHKERKSHYCRHCVNGKAKAHLDDVFRRIKARFLQTEAAMRKVDVQRQEHADCIDCAMALPRTG